MLFFPLNFSKDTNPNWKTASSYHPFLQVVASPTPPGESRQVAGHWMLMGHPQDLDAAACVAILSKAAFRDTAWDSLGPESCCTAINRQINFSPYAQALLGTVSGFPIALCCFSRQRRKWRPNNIVLMFQVCRVWREEGNFYQLKPDVGDTGNSPVAICGMHWW